MDSVHHDDFGGAAAGLLGSLLAYARTPEGRRKLLVACLSGLIIGFGINAYMKWQHDNIPEDVRWFTSAIGGILSGILIELLFTVAARISGRLVTFADKKADAMGLPAAPVTITTKVTADKITSATIETTAHADNNPNTGEPGTNTCS